MIPAAQPIDAGHTGIGLRTPHYSELWATRPALPFLEVHSENYFGDGGQPIDWLLRFRREYSLSLHGVGLSLGSGDELSERHLAKLARLVGRCEPSLVSEHLCWSAVGGRHLNDLLPLPYTEEALQLMVDRVDHVQTTLKRQILIENVSSYLQFTASTLTEWEFVAALAAQSGCGILLDVNNIYVNAVNHGFDPHTFLAAMPAAAVQEIHLAGFDRLEDATADCLIDTHGTAVCDVVWALYAQAIARLGPVPTLIEWDADLPPLPTLLAEADKANAILKSRADRPVAA